MVTLKASVARALTALEAAPEFPVLEGVLFFFFLLGLSPAGAPIALA